MARPLRIQIAGGWYHITSRGQRRQRIYCDNRDREEFLARLAAASQRYRIEVHAYVLMPNHYHLILRTPNANASAAMQWLNNGYGMWWNRRHGQVGHVFQGRFKSILVEEGAWLLSLSLYLHFNPVAVQELGLDKQAKKAEALGLTKATPEALKARLETLRTYRWSSYPAYAGYETSPEWLKTATILARVDGGQAGYRRMAETRLRQGEAEAVWSNLKWNVVLGSESFAERMRQRAEVVRETTGRRDLRGEVTWEKLVAALEKVRGERWEAFAGRHGDWGRDLILWLARRHTGMTLKDLGDKAGGLDYSAVSEAVRRFERRRSPLKEVQATLVRLRQMLNMET